MQKLGWIVASLVVSASAAHAKGASNPAFLGVGLGNTPAPGCHVSFVNEGSGAEQGGVHADDLIVAIDGVQVTSCGDLTAAITSKSPGDVVKLDVVRGTGHVALRPTLSSRADILHKRWVGRALDATEVKDLDDGRVFELGDVNGHIVVLALFDVRSCGYCPTVVRRLADTIGKLGKTSPIRLQAVTQGDYAQLASLRTSLAVGAPIAVAPLDFYQRAAITEGDRIHVMVIDGRGVVRFVTPIAVPVDVNTGASDPDSDDLDAAIDEVLAAAQQAEHARTSRR